MGKYVLWLAPHDWKNPMVQNNVRSHKCEDLYKSLDLLFLDIKVLYDLVVPNTSTGFQGPGIELRHLWVVYLSGPFIQAF